MHKLYPLLFALIAAISFYAGYSVGLRKAPTVPTRDFDMPHEVNNQNLEVEAQPAIETEQTMLLDDPETEAFALRAAQSEITSTDTKGRTLVAEILGVSSDSIQIRSLIDDQNITLPVSMHSEQDQALVAYLEQKEADARQED